MLVVELAVVEELPANEVAILEVGVGNEVVLSKSTIVSPEPWRYQRRKKIVNIKHSPRTTSARTTMVAVSKDNTDNSTSEYDNKEDQADNDRDSVFPKTGRFLPSVHNGGATAVDGVIRLHGRARGSRVAVAFELLEVADRLVHRFEHDLGQRVLYRLGILGEAAWAGLGRRVLGRPGPQTGPLGLPLLLHAR